MAGCGDDRDPPRGGGEQAVSATRPAGVAADRGAAADEPRRAEAVRDAMVVKGERLFVEYGCLNCHHTQEPEDSYELEMATGPPLYGIVGQEVSLISGEVVVRDDAYLERAIVDPEADKVGGYYADMVPLKPVEGWDVEPLVAYITCLSPPAGEEKSQ